MMRVRILIKEAEFQLCEQSEPEHPTVYIIRNAITDQVIDGGLQPDDLLSKLIHLSTVRLPEVQV